MTTPQFAARASGAFTLSYPHSLGTYSTYAEAQAVVDNLSDNEFEVQNCLIVGTDLKQVERVTGRLGWGKVLLSGVLNGLMLGLFIGILFMWLSAAPLFSLLTMVVFGVIIGIAMSAISYAVQRGSRDFTSVSATIPMRYELLVEHSHASRAREILGSATGIGAAGTGTAGTGTAGTGTAVPAPGAGTPRTDRPGAPAYGQPASGVGAEPGTDRPRAQYGQPGPAPQAGSQQPATGDQDQRP